MFLCVVSYLLCISPPPKVNKPVRFSKSAMFVLRGGAIVPARPRNMIFSVESGDFHCPALSPGEGILVVSACRGFITLAARTSLTTSRMCSTPASVESAGVWWGVVVPIDVCCRPKRLWPAHCWLHSSSEQPPTRHTNVSTRGSAGTMALVQAQHLSPVGGVSLCEP